MAAFAIPEFALTLWSWLAIPVEDRSRLDVVGVFDKDHS
jgi:hypothetical protein